MPHGRGWAEEPLDVITAITILESESNRIENEEMDKKMHKNDKVQGAESFKKGDRSP